MKNIKNILGNTKNIIGSLAAYFLAIVMLIAIVLSFLNYALADTSNKAIHRHNKLYDQRIDNDQAQSKFIEGNKYQKMMSKMDKFDEEDQRLTDEMIEIQERLKKECMYWDSEYKNFYEGC